LRRQGVRGGALSEYNAPSASAWNPTSQAVAPTPILTVHILAIETSAERGSVALAHATGVVQRHQAAGTRVAERALSMIAGLLADQAVTLSQVDAFAFGSGPGAFTGLRVACALAQGLAFAGDRPVIAVGSLRALAYGAARQALPAGAASAGPAPRVMAAIDARMNQVYWAVYEGEQAERCLAAAALAAPGELSALVARWRPQVIAGDALRAFRAAWPAQCEAACLPDLAADASMIAELARADLAAGRAIAARDAAPEYVRDQVALTVAQRTAAAHVPIDQR
jgi:tRNA threonylcarbamoyladenosine biosynthesis protein TsaB